MNVLLYSEGMKWISKSGLGRAIEHQKTALKSVGVTFTTDVNEKVDVVHINTYFLKSYHLAKKMKKKNIPIVYHAHSTEEDFRNSFLFSNQLSPLFRRWIVHSYNLGDVVVTPTEYAKELLIHSGVTSPIVAVSNGIDLSYYQENKEMKNRFREKYHYHLKDKIIMSVGLYIKRKGIIDFVELAKRMPDYQFIWFGFLNLNQVPKEIRLAVETELPNLIFAGYVTPEELRDAYAGTDLFFFPTYEETEGIVLLEAMAMKQNILVRDIPIYKIDFVEDVHVYKGKTNDDFKLKIKMILEGSLPSLKENASEKIKDKDITKIGEQLLFVYKKAMGIKSPL
ncbi:glycosyltransferase [Jeotgalibaca sp. MA1X17-3]|uniref:glycosyltransferase n=1 Tax=Jeotgalibaca sp. MA1X17-3 TaxID=2908211 RepID=UPI001F3231C1|nr:glycosyltransferase [Jeotgalibaca sp. MA1X17-3]UJF15132.1 glycosyltransferase [Jeotgalibaca sp. MA1X17-3]